MSELQQTSVLYKTESGSQAFKDQTSTLSMKAKTLLILIDGKKTVQDLCKFSPDPAQVSQWIAELQAAGLVSLIAPAIAAAATPEAVNAPVVTSAPRIDLKLSIRNATRALEGLLGPSSEPMCLQIEKCKSYDELVAKVNDLHKVVASVRSASKADEFVAKALST